MHSFRAFRLLCLIGILFALSQSLALGAELPSLEGPATYAGEDSYEKETYRAFLYLGKTQGFVLREEVVLSNGKVATWEITGKWYQIRNGAFLQLINNSGQYRLLNVGGEGNLYLDTPMPSGKRVSMVLRLRSFASPEYTISGILRDVGKETTLEDLDSGIKYALLSTDAVALFLNNHMHNERREWYVRAKVTAPQDLETPFLLEIKHIQNIPPQKKWERRDTSQDFFDLVVGSQWRLTRIAEHPPSSLYVLSFKPVNGEEGGKLEIFANGRRAMGKYTLQGSDLSISTTGLNARLAALFQQTRSWRMTGEVLELWTENHVIALLEKRL